MSALLPRWLRGAARASGPAPVEPPATSPAGSEFWARFEAEIADLPVPSVLEVGTLQAFPGRPTHRQASFPSVPREAYVMADIQAGPDVDVVADLHALPAEWEGRFGAFLAFAVFEHLERPWIAAREVARVLAPGGLFAVGTHQTFPLHGFPNDFFRFSKEALSLIFTDAGLVVAEAAYQDRCVILPPPHLVPRPHIAAWNADHPSYILVSVLGRKPS